MNRRMRHFIPICLLLGVSFGIAGRQDGKQQRLQQQADQQRTIAQTLAVKTNQAEKTLTGHTGFITSLAFSPDGKTLASGSEDNTVGIWDLSTGKLELPLQGSDGLNRLHMGWDVVDRVAFSKDGSFLAAANRDRTIKLWNMRTRKLFKTLQVGINTPNIIGSLVFSSDGKTLLSASTISETVMPYKYKGLAEMWNTETWTAKEPLNLDYPLLAFSPDDRIIALRPFKDVILWDKNSGTLWRTLTDAGDPKMPQGFANVFTATFTRDGMTVATGGAGVVKIWDVRTGKLLHVLSRPDTGFNLVDIVVFSPDGKTLASAFYDGCVLLWSVNTGQLRLRLNYVREEEKREAQKQADAVTKGLFRIFGLAFSPDGKMLACGGDNRTIKLWTLAQ